MTAFPGLMTAVIGPWLLGAGIVLRALDTRQPGRWALVAGLGFYLGTLLAAVTSLVAIYLFHTRPNLGFSAVLLLAGLWLWRRPIRTIHFTPASLAHPTGTSIIFAMLFAWIVVTQFMLTSEAWNRPLTAWDAWQNWAPRARVWFETGHYVAFLPDADWLAGPAASYRLLAYHRAILAPLLMLWTAGPADTWLDSWATVLWPLCWLSMGLSLYGALRASATNLRLAVLGMFALLSLPYLQVQAALPGYADIWVAGFLLALLAASTNPGRSRGKHWLTGSMALGLLLSKDVAVVWLLMWVIGVNSRRITAQPHRWLAGLGVAFLLLVYLVSPTTIVAPLLGKSLLSYHAGTISALAREWFLSGNWALLAPLGMAVLPMAFARPYQAAALASQSLIITIQAMTFLLFVFVFTHLSKGLLKHDIFNRAFLHVAPMIVAWAFATLAATRPKPDVVNRS